MAETQPELVVDAELVDDDPTPPAPQTAPSTALVRRERRSEVLHPLDVDQLAASFEEYQQLLPRLLKASDYQDAGRDRDGNPRRFVKKSGWRKIATAFDLDVILVSDEVERDTEGRVLRAKVIARAIAPSGRTMDGDGYCAADESRFTSGKGDTSKLENDLRATATTRAKNRAIADLVGMGDVSAEEVGDEHQSNGNGGPPYGPVVEDDTRKRASQALIGLCRDNADVAEATWGEIKTLLGYMPQAAAAAIVLLGEALEVIPLDPVFVDADGVKG